MEKLSSGYRINRAGDDAAGLAISEKMRAQIKGLSQASRNAQDGISMIQTAEGALNESHSILQRMRELAVQSANDTNVDADRTALQNEVDQLSQELTRISNNTEFNNRTLLNGALQTANLGEVTFHIGANEGQNVALGIVAMDAFSLGVAGTSATVAGATDITDATVGAGGGTSIVDAEVLTISTTEVQADAAGQVTLATGMTIDVSSGAELNGYSFVLGTVADGTPESATVSGTKIVINGDFTNSGFSTTGNVQTAINNALSAAGLTSTVTVGGAVGAGTANSSGAIAGGIDNSFTVNVVDTQGNSGDFTGVAIDATSLALTGASFSGVSLTLDGAITSGMAATVTLNTGAAASFSGGATTAATVTTGLNISTQATADSAITTINSALTTVSDTRAKLGAYQNRLEHTISNLDTSAENLQASESRIRDVDMAKEMMEFTKNNILQQAAQSMLAQANQAPQGVLQLLR
jgi:flagellin